MSNSSGEVAVRNVRRPTCRIRQPEGSCDEKKLPCGPSSSFNMFQPVKQNNLPKIEKTETRPLEMRAEQTQTHAQPWPKWHQNNIHNICINSFICEHWNFETARNNLRCHHNKSLRWKTTCFHESWRPSRLCTTFSQLFLGGSDRLQSSKITETRSRLPIAEIRLTTRDVTIQKIAGLTTKCIGWCRISISNINSQKSRFWFWIVE